MGILRSHDKVDYEKIREKLEREEMTKWFWSSVQDCADGSAQTIEPKDFNEFWEGTTAGEYYTCPTLEEKKTIRRREREQLVAQNASAKYHQPKNNVPFYRTRQQPSRCTNQRGRR